MRSAMIAPAVLIAAITSACGGNGGEAPGPERRSAAGEVLGGEISDAMVPLDAVRSTSPVAPRPTATGTAAPGRIEERRAVLPRPEMSGGPEPLPSGPGPEDTPPPTPEP